MQQWSDLIHLVSALVALTTAITALATAVATRRRAGSSPHDNTTD
jgi:hypothetical protein